MVMAVKPVKDTSELRITDIYTRKQVEAERQRRGHGTATRTAMALIIERLAQLDHERRYPPRDEQTSTVQG